VRALVSPSNRARCCPTRAAFESLDPQHREVLRLRFLEDLGYDKVAERLDVTEHAARQRVYRAMQALRAALRLRPT
jgi:RNA polymerase sigma factor (sigma-70 family)